MKHEIEIFDMEITTHDSNSDYIRDRHSVNLAWDIVVLCDDVKYDGEYSAFYSDENSGTSFQMKSKKPKGMSDDDFDEITDAITEFLDADYRENRRDWEDD